MLSVKGLIMYIAVTGYSGTGATAVYSLLKEYDSCSFVERSQYEHIPFYTPNGLFDLEYKLLYCNNLHRSDEALLSFKKEMKRLYDNDFGWMGGYKNIVGADYLYSVNEFVDSLLKYSVKGFWSYDCVGQKIKVSRVIKDLVKLILGREIVSFGREVIVGGDNTILLSFPSNEEFFLYAREYIYKYMNLFKKRENVLFDHLLMPSDINKIDKYFDEDFRLIIVDRDIRDVYLYSKYIRPKLGSNSKYPSDVDEFGDFWSKLRSLEKGKSLKVLRIYFEDIIFNYEKTITRLETFTGLKANDHVNKGLMFDRQYASEYVQLYKKNEKWNKEVLSLLEKYPDYIFVSSDS